MFFIGVPKVVLFLALYSVSWSIRITDSDRVVVYSKSDYDAPTVVEAFDVKLRGNGNSAAEEKEFNGDVEDDKDEAENTDDDDDNCKECEDEELGEDMVFPVSEDSGELASVSESGKKEILIGMFVVLLVYSCVMIVCGCSILSLYTDNRALNRRLKKRDSSTDLDFVRLRCSELNVQRLKLESEESNRELAVMRRRVAEGLVMKNRRNKWTQAGGFSQASTLQSWTSTIKSGGENCGSLEEMEKVEVKPCGEEFTGVREQVLEEV